MLIRIDGSVLVGGVWHEPGVGNYDPALAQHLIDIGVAVPVEQKIVEPEVKKKRGRPRKSGGASQPARASQSRTAKKSED